MSAGRAPCLLDNRFSAMEYDLPPCIAGEVQRRRSSQSDIAMPLDEPGFGICYRVGNHSRPRHFGRRMKRATPCDARRAELLMMSGSGLSGVEARAIAMIRSDGCPWRHSCRPLTKALLGLASQKTCRQPSRKLSRQKHTGDRAGRLADMRGASSAWVR